MHGPVFAFGEMGQQADGGGHPSKNDDGGVFSGVSLTIVVPCHKSLAVICLHQSRLHHGIVLTPPFSVSSIGTCPAFLKPVRSAPSPRHPVRHQHP